MTSIQAKKNNDYFHICGGSVINKNFVLSAAHCFESFQQSDMKCVFGTSDLSYSTPERQEIEIEEIIKHPKYKKGTSYYDMALIKLTQDLEFSDSISPICIPELATQDANHRAHDATTLTGWGATESKGQSSSILRQGQLTIFDTEYCNASRIGLDRHGNMIAESNLVPDLFQSSVLCAGKVLSISYGRGINTLAITWK